MAKPRVVFFLGEDVFPTGEGFFEARKVVAGKIAAAIAGLKQKYEIVLTYRAGHRKQENVFQAAEKVAMANLAEMANIEAAGEQGKNGFILEQALKNAFLRQGENRKVATIVSQSIVEKNDALRRPTCPVGQTYSAREALKLIKTRNWTMKEVSRGKFQRLLPAGLPVDLAQKREIYDLLTAGAIVIAESGSVPVYRTKVLKILKNVEVAVESDFAAEKLAELVRADVFVSVMSWPELRLMTEHEREVALRELTAKEAKTYLQNGQFAPKVVTEKIEAHAKFARRQKLSVLCGISNLEEALNGKAGTKII